MGIITKYTDPNTGLVLDQAYVSLCAKNQMMILATEEVAAGRAKNPTTTHGKWNGTITMAIYSTKEARTAGKNPISQHVLTIYFDDVAKMPEIAYSELKSAFPNYSDDI